MKRSFKNRIAFYFLLTTALIVLVVFFTIFYVVQESVYLHLDNDLIYEAQKHTTEIKVDDNNITFINKAEWEEREHREVEVNPVFIQIVDLNGNLMDKSPNLKEGSLTFNPKIDDAIPFNTELKGNSIRQIQIPITYKKQQVGELLAAMSFEDSRMVLGNLKKVLWISFPIVLGILFIATRLLAGRSINPVINITDTTNRINKNNLNERITLPANKDELYELTSSINSLLDRIEQVINREKQFTSDASHELRTPLAVLKGTLEVLNRKPRSPQEYQEKIDTAIYEIDRMSHIVEQLLLLARMDNRQIDSKLEEVNLEMLVDHILVRLNHSLKSKALQVHMQTSGEMTIRSNRYLAELILENIIGNAVKYSKENTEVGIQLTRENNHTKCTVTDQGIGIRKEDFKDIFSPFFRSDALNHKHIAGNGLGLTIVDKACYLLSVKVSFESELNRGSTFIINFPDN